MTSVVFNQPFKFSPDGTRVIEFAPGPQPQEVSPRCAELAIEVGAAVAPSDAAGASSGTAEREAFENLLREYDVLSAEAIELRRERADLVGQLEVLTAEIAALRGPARVHVDPVNVAAPAESGQSTAPASDPAPASAGARPRKASAR